MVLIVFLWNLERSWCCE